eukprot:910690-Alexandrium_andersonii.AAC.1
MHGKRNRPQTRKRPRVLSRTLTTGSGTMAPPARSTSSASRRSYSCSARASRPSARALRAAKESTGRSNWILQQGR